MSIIYSLPQMQAFIQVWILAVIPLCLLHTLPHEGDASNLPVSPHSLSPTPLFAFVSPLAAVDCGHWEIQSATAALEPCETHRSGSLAECVCACVVVVVVCVCVVMGRHSISSHISLMLKNYYFQVYKLQKRGVLLPPTHNSSTEIGTFHRMLCHYNTQLHVWTNKIRILRAWCRTCNTPTYSNL